MNRSGRSFLLVLVVLVLLAATAGGGGLYYASLPSFCNSCHIMQTRYVSWKRSSHGDRVKCITCHSEPGLWGEMKAHIEGTRYIYALVTGERSGPILKAKVGNPTCLQCHAERARAARDRVARRRGDHAAHVRADVSCGACHGSLVHGSLSGRDPLPPQARCASCHKPLDPRLASPG